MEQTNVIIIDDEQHCCLSLQDALASVGGQKYIVRAVCNSAEEGRRAITEHSPDLVFLDVFMPGKTGLEMLEEMEVIDFDIIFTTAYSEYALQALKLSAVDYLLKPIGATDMASALGKYEQSINKNSLSEQIQVLIQYNQKQDSSRKIALPSANGFDFVLISEILHLEAQKNYSIVYMANNKKTVIAKTLKEFEELLSPFGFSRVHQSHLVNLRYIKSYTRGNGGFLTMDDNTQIEVSRQKKEEFLKTFKNIRTF